MSTQGDKLLQALVLAVEHLDDLDAIASDVRTLGERHHYYGVVESDFETVGSVLLWTLEHSLGARFTPEVREAWVAVYGVLAGAMKQGLAARSAQAAD